MKISLTDKKLYRVTTGLGIDYIVANNAGEAEVLVKGFYTAEDYGFGHERVVIRIELIAEGKMYPSSSASYSHGCILFDSENLESELYRKERRNETK
jgi:hypothetical protein